MLGDGYERKVPVLSGGVNLTRWKRGLAEEPLAETARAIMLQKKQYDRHYDFLLELARIRNRMTWITTLFCHI
jgi:hypothetical protein